LRPDLAVYIIDAPDTFDDDTRKEFPRRLSGPAEQPGGGSGMRRAGGRRLGASQRRRHLVGEYRVNFKTAPLR